MELNIYSVWEKKLGIRKATALYKIVCKMEVTKGLTARHALVGRKKGGTKATFKKERKKKSDDLRADHHSDLLQGLETRSKHY